MSPPQVGIPAPQTHVLKDWGVPPTDEEALAIETLEEFIHLKWEVPYARIARKRPALQDSRSDIHDPQSRQIARSSTYEVSLERPTTRPRYYTASISNLIPQVLRICSVYLHSGLRFAASLCPRSACWFSAVGQRAPQALQKNSAITDRTV